MAKRAIKKTAKKVVKKVVKKVLDSTELDEKLIAEYNENKTLVDTVLCYVKCYGGYILAVGAGCTFATSLLWGTVLLAASAYWAWKRNCPCKCGNGTCSK